MSVLVVHIWLCFQQLVDWYAELIERTCPSAAFGMIAILPRPQGFPGPTVLATDAAASPQTTSSFTWTGSPACTAFRHS